MNPSDNFEASLKWIVDMRKRFEYFSMLSEHASKTLDRMEYLLLENRELRGSLQSFLTDLDRSAESITYERDSLKNWIQDVLNWKPEKTM